MLYFGPLSGGLDRFRRSEYTGENRCVPCTLLNLFISILTSATIATITLGGGILVFVLCTITIYMRGYLVPGTPEITRQYAPDWFLSWFGKSPTRTQTNMVDPSVEVGEGDEMSGSELLSAVNIITECETKDDLCLTSDFRNAWHEQIAAQGGDFNLGYFEEAIGIDSDRITVDGDIVYLRRNEIRKDQWGSSAASIADAAAAKVLCAQYPFWDDIPLDDRRDFLQGLRVFLDNCPVCHGSISIDRENRSASRCGGDHFGARCENCGESFI